MLSARMFVRMRTTELADVRENSNNVCGSYPAIIDACEELQLRQIIIPTMLVPVVLDVMCARIWGRL